MTETTETPFITDAEGYFKTKGRFRNRRKHDPTPEQLSLLDRLAKTRGEGFTFNSNEIKRIRRIEEAIRFGRAVLVGGVAVAEPTEGQPLRFNTNAKYGAALFGQHAEVEAGAEVGDGVVVEWGTKIGTNVEIGPNVKIGSWVVVEWGTKIGPNVEIGQDTNIGPNVVVEWGTKIGPNVEIGQDTNIGPNVVVGWGTEIGLNVVVKASAQLTRKSVIPPDSTVPAGATTVCPDIVDYL